MKSTLSPGPGAEQRLGERSVIESEVQILTAGHFGFLCRFASEIPPLML